MPLDAFIANLLLVYLFSRRQFHSKALGDKTEMTVTEYDLTAGRMFDYSATGLNQSLIKGATSFARA